MPSIALYGTCEGMLTFYSDIYSEFPFMNEKYGHATCTSLGALAMEHQTCTSFDAGYISDDAAEYTVAHELGHSWAGDCLSLPDLGIELHLILSLLSQPRMYFSDASRSSARSM